MVSSRALSKFVLALKTAAAEPEEEPAASHTARNLAVGGAALSPFLGAIGQRPVQHDPLLNTRIRRYKSMAELARDAKPGDMLLTSKPEGSFWKYTIAPLTGSEFYHVQPVVGRRGGMGTSTSAGSFSDPSFAADTQKQLLQQSLKIPEELMNEGYPDAVLLRPKTPMTPDQLKAFKKDMMARAQAEFNRKNAVGSWLHDLFVPKLKMFEKGKNMPTCEGGICSSAPAMAYNEAGIQIAKGKAARNAFPGDFLRSDALHAVGAYVPNKYKPNPILRRATPYLTRGAIGAGLAGTLYAGTEDPALLAAVPGMALGSAAGGQIERLLRQKKKAVPSFRQGVLVDLLEATPLQRERMLRRLLTGRVPGALLGGALAYGGGRALLNALKSRGAATAASPQPDEQPAHTD